MKYCAECGHQAEEGDRFCGDCGEPFEQDGSEPEAAAGVEELPPGSSDTIPSVLDSPELLSADDKQEPIRKKRKVGLVVFLVLAVMGGLIVVAGLFVASNYESWLAHLFEDPPVHADDKPPLVDGPPLKEPYEENGKNPQPIIKKPALPTPEPAPPIPKSVPVAKVPSPPKPFWEMTKQTYFDGTDFPKQKIKDSWAEGFFVTSMAFDGTNWLVVMSKGPSYHSQAYVTGQEFPKEKIQDYWEKNYAITNVIYGAGYWVVIMSKGSPLSGQSWILRKQIPDEEIAEKWKDGYRITGMEHGGGTSVVVFSKNSGIERQKWRTESLAQDLFDHAKKFALEGLAMQSLDVNYPLLTAVFSEGITKQEQYYSTTPEFPAGEIDKKWKEGLRIVDINYGGGVWALVMTRF